MEPKRIVIIDDEFVSLWWYPESGIVHHQIHRYLSGARLRETLEAGIVALEKGRARKWLSDDRRNGALPTADVEWTRDDWFPRAIASGWRHWALVQPEGAIGQMNIRRITEDYARKGLAVRVFDDPDAAFEWLRVQ